MNVTSTVRLSGPLLPYAEGFRVELARLGYTPLSAANQLRLVAHLSRWLQASDRRVEDLVSQVVDEFLKTRRAAGYTCWLSRRGLAPLLGYLRSIGAVPPEELVVRPALVEQYSSYLRSERALVETTIRHYVETAVLFLDALSERHLEPAGITTAVVSDFVLSKCRQRSVGYSKNLVTNLRSFLRFLYLAGHLKASLAEAVPAVAGWRIATLPRPPEKAVVGALLGSCDRRRGIGRRDYAILCLLIRLGLRSGEVAHLELGDIDWHQGEILVRGKGSRHDRLPLPVDVGEAVVAYLRRGRGPSEYRHVFLRARAPKGPLDPTAVTAIVREACLRCGIEPFGAHQLRHAAASQLLAKGVLLEEIAQVLRHRSLMSTAIYAKVDHRSLRALAQPWPGKAS